MIVVILVTSISIHIWHLNGVENLNQAKQTATGALQHLSHLNQAQIDALNLTYLL
jgi:hypothetical protein